MLYTAHEAVEAERKVHNDGDHVLRCLPVMRYSIRRIVDLQSHEDTCPQQCGVYQPQSLLPKNSPCLLVRLKSPVIRAF